MAIPFVLKGYKTYLAATGLVALSVYQFSTGQVVPGFHSLFSALAAAGLRSAVSGQKS